jgi:hypothetical protein
MKNKWSAALSERFAGPGQLNPLQTLPLGKWSVVNDLTVAIMILRCAAGSDAGDLLLFNLSLEPAGHDAAYSGVQADCSDQLAASVG